MGIFERRGTTKPEKLAPSHRVTAKSGHASLSAESKSTDGVR